MHQKAATVHAQGLSCAELEATLLWLTRDAPDALLPLLTAHEQAGGVSAGTRTAHHPAGAQGPSEFSEGASQRALRRLTLLSFQLYDGLRLAAPHLSARPEQQLPFLHAAAVALYQPLASCAFDAQRRHAPIADALDAALQSQLAQLRAPLRLERLRQRVQLRFPDGPPTVHKAWLARRLVQRRRGRRIVEPVLRARCGLAQG